MNYDNKLIIFLANTMLGDGGALDHFGPGQLNLYSRDQFFINWLDEIGPDIIILSGNIYDRFHYPWSHIRKAHRRICKLFVSKKALYVPGQTDYWHGFFRPLTRLIEIPIEGEHPLRILVSNGFQGLRSPIKRFVDMIQGPPRKGPDADELKAHVLQYTGQCDIVVTGHGPWHDIQTYNGSGDIVGIRPVIHASCGMCINGKFHGILCHTGRRKISRITS